MNHEKPTTEEIKLLERFTGIGQFKKIDPNAKLKMSVPAIIAFSKYYHAKKIASLKGHELIAAGIALEAIHEAARKECEQRIEENFDMKKEQKTIEAYFNAFTNGEPITIKGEGFTGEALITSLISNPPEPPKEIKDFDLKHVSMNSDGSVGMGGLVKSCTNTPNHEEQKALSLEHVYSPDWINHSRNGDEEALMKDLNICGAPRKEVLEQRIKDFEENYTEHQKNAAMGIIKLHKEELEQINEKISIDVRNLISEIIEEKLSKGNRSGINDPERPFVFNPTPEDAERDIYIAEIEDENNQLRKTIKRLKKKLKKLKRAKSHVEMFDKSVIPNKLTWKIAVTESEEFYFVMYDNAYSQWYSYERKDINEIDFKYCELPKGLKY